MNLGYAKPLFLVAFDQRASFSRGLFGASEPLPPGVVAGIKDAKELIFEAFERSLALGASRTSCGILVDEQFGTSVAHRAKARDLLLAMPVEKSGQREFQLEYGDDFVRHIDAFDPDFCKVLVRYNPEDDDALNRRQTVKLAQLSSFLHAHDRKFLFELLVPATPEQLARCGGQERYDRELRGRLVVEVLRELQAGGVEPDIWKIEGLETQADCEHVVAQARGGVGRSEVVCIILGRGASLERVLGWLANAAPVPGFVGFAIGRTLWRDALALYLAGQATREETREVIAKRYLRAMAAYVEGATRGREAGAHPDQRAEGMGGG